MLYIFICVYLFFQLKRDIHMKSNLFNDDRTKLLTFFVNTLFIKHYFIIRKLITFSKKLLTNENYKQCNRKCYIFRDFWNTLLITK